MRIGLLTQWYDPEPGPAALPGMLARGLRDRGHDVQVVTGFPNYPTGEIAEGYRQERRFDEMLDGISVRRVALYANHDASTARRMANYGSFALSASVSGLDVLRDVDVLWVNYSPVTIGLPMRLQRRLRGTPLLVHVGDLWPDTLFASRFGGAGRPAELLESALARWCNAMYERAEVVSYISPGVGDVLRGRGVPAAKLAYAPMWADEAVVSPAPLADERSAWGLAPDDVALVYAGTLGNAQELTTFVRAVARTEVPGLRVLVAGSGTEEQALRSLAERDGAPISWLGRLDAQEMAHLMAASDVHYVGLNDHPLARITMPSKVQSILASGRPIVGSLVGDAADVVQRSGGWTAEPGDVAALVGAIRAAAGLGRTGLAAAGASARRLYDDEFGMRGGIDRFETLLQQAAGQRKVRR